MNGYLTTGAAAREIGIDKATRTRWGHRGIADLQGYHGLSARELAVFMDIRPTRARQLLARGREHKENPVTELATLPEQLHIALAIITYGKQVLIAKRKDGIPPWTFPGGDHGGRHYRG